MATTRAMLERRRSSRVFIRIPVQLFSNGVDGEPLVTLAEAIAVSRCGALFALRSNPVSAHASKSSTEFPRKPRNFASFASPTPKIPASSS